MIARCRLGDVEDRILGHLSKGYRQRVGLAEAMVHDPDILILDEPTAGLDPIQIREVRALIRELGDRHTILLSTHIMSEVEAVCGRVIIIARGRIAVDDRLDRIRTESAIVVEARGPAEPIRAAAGDRPGRRPRRSRRPRGGLADVRGPDARRRPTCARRSPSGWCRAAGRCAGSTCAERRWKSGSSRRSRRRWPRGSGRADAEAA